VHYGVVEHNFGCGEICGDSVVKYCRIVSSCVGRRDGLKRKTGAGFSVFSITSETTSCLNTKLSRNGCRSEIKKNSLKAQRLGMAL
jgi:hypothetical protein